MVENYEKLLGANLADDTDTFYRAKARLRMHGKVAVALNLVSQLREGDSLLIDAGTSLTPVAQIIALLARDRAPITHYTIMTHNNGAFRALVPPPTQANLNVFLTGGRYDDDLYALFGDQAQEAYANFFPKWVLIGQSGLHATVGLFCHGNTEELALKKQIFEKPTDTRVIISDWSKIGQMGGLCFGPAERLGLNAWRCVVLTDEPPGDTPREKRENFEAQCGLLDEIHGVTVQRVRFEVGEVDADSVVMLKSADGQQWSVRVSQPDKDLGGVPRLSELRLPTCYDPR